MCFYCLKLAQNKLAQDRILYSYVSRFGTKWIVTTVIVTKINSRCHVVTKNSCIEHKTKNWGYNIWPAVQWLRWLHFKLEENLTISTIDKLFTFSLVTTHNFVYCLVKCCKPKDYCIQRQCFARSQINKQCIKHTTAFTQSYTFNKQSAIIQE